MTYNASNAIYIALDQDTLDNLEEDGLVKLPMAETVVVIELTEFSDPETDAQERRPGVA